MLIILILWKCRKQQSLILISEKINGHQTIIAILFIFLSLNMTVSHQFFYLTVDQILAITFFFAISDFDNSLSLCNDNILKLFLSSKNIISSLNFNFHPKFLPDQCSNFVHTLIDVSHPAALSTPCKIIVSSSGLKVNICNINTNTQNLKLKFSILKFTYHND